MKALLLFFVAALCALAQFNSSAPPGSSVVKSNPDGTSCVTAKAGAKIYNGTIYTCQSGAYAAIAGSGGGGTGTVTHTVGTLTTSAIVSGNGGADVKTPSIKATVDSTGNISATSFATSGTTPGVALLAAGTGNVSALASSSAGFAAPNSGGTSYLLKLPATITAGFLRTATPATAEGVNESALSVTSTVAISSGTAALGTSAIASGACAAAVTASAVGVLSSDVISFTPNADITGVTGYAPVTTGGLSIYPYPSIDTVSFKVCNRTGSSITPGAVTLNWSVIR